MKSLKKAIAYVRVSTEEQGNDGKFGVEVQKSAISEWANQHDYVITKFVVEKMSGAKERPLMNEIVFGDDGATNPPYQAVIVYKNDRIARDMKLYFYYEYVLNKKGIELLCVQDDFLNGVDSSVATLYKAMMQFVAEQERKNITMRTSSGRIAKAKTGGYSGGGVPYGYKAVGNNLVVDEFESEVVRRLFVLWDDTESYRKVQKGLLEWKPDLVGRKGNTFSYFSIRSIVENRTFYEGLYRYSNLGYVIGKHEPILQMSESTKEFFEKENKRIEDECKLEESGEIYG